MVTLLPHLRALGSSRTIWIRTRVAAAANASAEPDHTDRAGPFNRKEAAAPLSGPDLKRVLRHGNKMAGRGPDSGGYGGFSPARGHRRKRFLVVNRRLTFRESSLKATFARFAGRAMTLPVQKRKRRVPLSVTRPCRHFGSSDLFVVRPLQLPRRWLPAPRPPVHRPVRRPAPCRDARRHPYHQAQQPLP